jgi:hypothetical protein
MPIKEVRLNYGGPGKFAPEPKTVTVNKGDTIRFIVGDGALADDTVRIKLLGKEKGGRDFTVEIGADFPARTTYGCELLDKSGKLRPGASIKGRDGGEIVLGGP